MVGKKTRNLKLEENILICLLCQKFTQEDVARMIHCSNSTVKLVVNGRTRRGRQAWAVLKGLHSLIAQYGVK